MALLAVYVSGLMYSAQLIVVEYAFFTELLTLNLDLNQNNQLFCPCIHQQLVLWLISLSLSPNSPCQSTRFLTTLPLTSVTSFRKLTDYFSGGTPDTKNTPVIVKYAPFKRPRLRHPELDYSRENRIYIQWQDRHLASSHEPDAAMDSSARDPPPDAILEPA
ncbi:hypothetical protein D9756_008259 [Leucocoprinus leucothites]|uniref:Uncharacterized protein n=1 Tax=Leucocoprinus leucothites TaxID=201217 RepID=A0A8H5D2T9_9AGAR|nr:hypothetical protein D9756_008259 [Leucoagaricus leucothites]